LFFLVERHGNRLAAGSRRLAGFPNLKKVLTGFASFVTKTTIKHFNSQQLNNK
jgi:hypothetical protein